MHVDYRDGSQTEIHFTSYKYLLLLLKNSKEYSTVRISYIFLCYVNSLHLSTFKFHVVA